MREISAISADLTKLASDITSKIKIKEDAQKAYTKSGNDLVDVQNKASELRYELDEALNVLVPQSFQGRVRQTS